ncbi:MAG: hypothetical protein QW228_01050 [Candidatus Aenigmatarchaeota archaeon]
MNKQNLKHMKKLVEKHMFPIYCSCTNNAIYKLDEVLPSKNTWVTKWHCTECNQSITLNYHPSNLLLKLVDLLEDFKEIPELKAKALKIIESVLNKK